LGRRFSDFWLQKITALCTVQLFKSELAGSTSDGVDEFLMQLWSCTIKQLCCLRINVGKILIVARHDSMSVEK